MVRLNISPELQIFGLSGVATLAKLTAHRASVSEWEGKPADAAVYRRKADAMHGKYLDLMAG